METIFQLLTVVGVVLGVLATGVFGPLAIYRVLSWVAEQGFRLGAGHRLARGRGGWGDLRDYAHGRWRRLPHRAHLLDRLGKYEAHAFHMEAETFRPDLLAAMYRWVRDGQPAMLMFDALDAGYDPTALDAHRTGTLVLDEAAVQTMRALRV